MLRVGLTGGIATGKSSVGQMFVELGCHLIDSDRITHELLQPGQEVHAAIVREFGNRILAPDGTIDRRILGQIVFKEDPEARARLNGLVHPAVIRRQQEWLREMEMQDAQGIAIVDAALMIEVGTYKNYDKVIVVTCPPEIQKQRLRRRSPLPDDEIKARIEAQMPLEEKVKYADFVIDTSGPMEVVIRRRFLGARQQVLSVYRRLKNGHGNNRDVSH